VLCRETRQGGLLWKIAVRT